jgi:hypothetical protein
MPTAKRGTTRKTATTPSSDTYKVKAARGRAVSGTTYKPAAGGKRAKSTMPEMMEPRPKTTSRYPISNEEFERLKAAAKTVKLAKVEATAAKDVTPKRRVGAKTLAPQSQGAEPVAAPAPSSNFAGISATGWLPPDCTMAVGPSHVLASVNSSMAIYTKAGALQLQRTLTQWFANVAQGLTIFDPKALYDQHAGRWVLMAVAINNATSVSAHLVSISTTSNPLGTWRNYTFNARLNGNTNTNTWADFPNIGVDNQALYITSNMFAFGGGFQYSKIRVIPKAGPYSGGPAPYFDFFNLKNADNTTAFTIQPCHTFGAPGVEYLVNTRFPSGNKMTVWRILNGGVAPTISRTEVTISPYSLAPNADQPGGGPPLNTGDIRVLHAVFRGDSIWTSFTKAHQWTAGGANRAAVQWCQIRAATPSVVQQGVYGAGSAHYFYPAMCPDANGNVTMVFSRSSTTNFGHIAFTGRRATDPLGTLQGSAVLKAGVAKYVGLDSGGRNRWGDYNGVCADPANGRVIWMYSMYASAVNTWGTWVGSSFF